MINIRNVGEGVARRPTNCQSVARGLSLCCRSPPLSFRHFYIKNRKSISHVRLFECTIKLLLLWYFENAVFIRGSLLSITYCGISIIIIFFFFCLLNIYIYTIEYYTIFNWILYAKQTGCIIVETNNVYKKKNLSINILYAVFQIKTRDWVSLINDNNNMYYMDPKSI